MAATGEQRHGRNRQEMNVRLSRCATDWGNERATLSLTSVVRCQWGERPPNRCGHQKMRERLFNTLAVEQKKRSHERLTQGALLVSIDGAELVLSELKRIKIEGQFIVGACEHAAGSKKSRTRCVSDNNSSHAARTFSVRPLRRTPWAHTAR